MKLFEKESGNCFGSNRYDSKQLERLMMMMTVLVLMKIVDWIVCYIQHVSDAVLMY